MDCYCKYYSQGIVVFLVSNAHVDSKLIIDYRQVCNHSKKTELITTCGLLEPGWGWFLFGKEVTLNGLHH